MEAYYFLGIRYTLEARDATLHGRGKTWGQYNPDSTDFASRHKHSVTTASSGRNFGQRLMTTRRLRVSPLLRQRELDGGILSDSS